MITFLLLQAETQLAPPLTTLPEGPVDFTWLFFKVIFAMVVVCLAAFAVIKYIIPRAHFIRRPEGSQVEILERFTLEPKKNLYILKIAKKILVLGTTESSMNSLLAFEERELPGESPKEK